MTSNNKTIITLIVLAILAVLLYGVLTMPDQRTTGERVGDAIDEAADGNLGDAAQELERRTPGERLGDAVEEAGEDIQDNTDNQ